MDDPIAAKPTREDRLAMKLRENLRRRKAQGRALSSEPGEPDSDPLPTPALSKPEGGG